MMTRAIHVADPGLRPKLALMSARSRADAATWAVQAAARLACSNVAHDAPPEANPLALCEWLRRRVRYLREGHETLVAFRPLMALGAGDCDDTACALAAMLLATQHRAAFGVGYDRRGAAAHVWALAWSPRYGWIHLDPSTSAVPVGRSPLDKRGSSLHRWSLHEVR